ncbi:hypothetical protein HPP92_026643 [Vanilla planifolia]|uniref:Uncharacterized protein n=1 Tax=Vanilla planifolia TaxID=51239 RepID=A0A835PDC8_VANPL|nr:hypothetical protein HPP92_026643 [Vanilla planifolia]
MVDETVPTAYQDSSSATDVSSSHPVPDCWSPVREETASSTSFEFVRSDRDPRLPTPPRPISASAYLPYRMPGDRRVHKYAVYRRGRFVITQPLPDTFEPGQELPPLFNKPFRFVDSPNFPVPNELRITDDSSDQRNRPPNERSQGLDLSDRLRNVRIDDVEHQAYLTLQEARGMLSYIESQLLPIQILQSKMQTLTNHISESSRTLTQILSQRNVASSSSSPSSHTGIPSPFFRQTVDGLDDMIKWLSQWISSMMVATPPNVVTFVDSSKPDLTSNILHLLVYLSNKVKNVRKLVETLKKDYPRADQ